MKTDIKEENIIVTLEDSDVLEEFVKFAKTGPLTQSTGPDGTVTHRSYEKKGSLRNMDFSVLLSGFNKAVLYKPDFGDFFLRPFIQNNLHRAPEVLLGTGWTKAMDVWSLGVLVCSPRRRGSCAEETY